MSDLKLSLENNGDLKIEGDVSAQSKVLLSRYESVFDLLKAGGDFDEARRQYAQRLVTEANAALHQGASSDANAPLLVEAEKCEASYSQFFQYRYGSVVLTSATHENAPQQVRFRRVPWLANVPDEAMAFLSRVEKMNRKVCWLIKDKSRLQQYLAPLESQARLGLEDGDIKSATVALDLLAEQFVCEEGPSIRQQYIRSTLIGTAWIVAAVLFFYVLLHLNWSKFLSALKSEDVLNAFKGAFQTGWTGSGHLPPTLTILCLVVGLSLGVTFFAFVRNLKLTFDSIGNFDPAALTSWLRFTLVGIVTALACLLMLLGLLKIGIGTIALEEFDKKPEIAILVGVICGYADVTITGMLTGVLDTVKRSGS